MKKDKLENLIREIVRHMLNEYSTLSSTDIKNLSTDNPSLDASTPPEDAMTTAEKNRLQQQATREKQTQIKQTEIELDAKKKKMAYQKQETDQLKRFDIPNTTKELQKLKGASI